MLWIGPSFFTITVEPLVINGGGSDHFSGRTDLGGVVNAQITTTNLGATGESNEPAHADNDAEVSIWWKWTAPSSGPVAFETFGSTFDTLLGVYTGDTLGGLTEVAGNDSTPVFVGLNAPFDWSFVNYYFHRYLQSNPFGFTALDIKALYMGATGSSWTDTRSSRMAARLHPKSKGDHQALHDAQYQAELFRLIRGISQQSHG